MAAAIVEFAGLTGGGFVFVEEFADGVVHRLGEDECFGVVGLGAEVLEGHGDGEEFAERIPAQMVLGIELLHVLGRGAARAGLEQTAAGEQRHDGKHLGAGAQFQNGKQSVR